MQANDSSSSLAVLTKPHAILVLYIWNATLTLCLVALALTLLYTTIRSWRRQVMGSSASESQDQSSTATVSGRRSLEDGHHNAADQPLPARAPIAMTLPRQQQINRFVYNTA